MPRSSASSAVSSRIAFCGSVRAIVMPLRPSRVDQGRCRPSDHDPIGAAGAGHPVLDVARVAAEPFLRAGVHRTCSAFGVSTASGALELARASPRPARHPEPIGPHAHWHPSKVVRARRAAPRSACASRSATRQRAPSVLELRVVERSEYARLVGGRSPGHGATQRRSLHRPGAKAGVVETVGHVDRAGRRSTPPTLRNSRTGQKTAARESMAS
jgi:hypothetical protein